MQKEDSDGLERRKTSHMTVAQKGNCFGGDFSCLIS